MHCIITFVKAHRVLSSPLIFLLSPIQIFPRLIQPALALFRQHEGACETERVRQQISLTFGLISTSPRNSFTL